MRLQDIFDKNQNFSGAIGLVLFSGDRVLVYERDGNTDIYPFHLDMPGGGREDGESPFETFQRELFEEFGLKVRPGDMIYGRGYIRKDLPGVQRFFLVCRLRDSSLNKIVFGDEGTHYEVVTLGNLLTHEQLIPSLRDRVEDYLAYARKA
jgi:8-oxo-dGTP diphosphatase